MWSVSLYIGRNATPVTNSSRASQNEALYLRALLIRDKPRPAPLGAIGALSHLDVNESGNPGKTYSYLGGFLSRSGVTKSIVTGQPRYQVSSKRITKSSRTNF